MKIRSLLAALGLPLSLLIAANFPGAAQAGTEAEYQALHTYCIGLIKWRLGGGKVARPYDQGLADIEYFLPYCEAMVSTGKLYTARSPTELRVTLAGIQTGLEFLISQLPRDHYLLPEVYAQLGKALYLARKYDVAEANLLEAVGLDPRHAAAYSTLADLYRDSKRRDKAIEAARAGLALDPERSSLRRIARELGIDVNKIKKAPLPAAKAAVKDDAAPAKPDAAPDPVPDAAATPPWDAAESGHPGNPWCRFCPENQAAPAAPSPSTPGVIPKDWR